MKDENYGKKSVKIGVTGTAGSGKSLVCSRFSRWGIAVVSCDEIARQVVMPGLPAYDALVSYFGRRIVLKDGTLDRSSLRRVISRSPAQREKLEGIVQPAILAELSVQMTRAVKDKGSIVAAEVPLLFELGLEDQFDFLITVAAEEEQRVQRIARRDRVSQEQAAALLAMQMSQQEKTAGADLVLWNTDSVDDFSFTVDSLAIKLKELAGLI
ncbi:MAG: dephospho-CoA kinase [Desulfobacteraceae bacterium]